MGVPESSIYPVHDPVLFRYWSHLCGGGAALLPSTISLVPVRHSIPATLSGLRASAVSLPVLSRAPPVTRTRLPANSFAPCGGEVRKNQPAAFVPAMHQPGNGNGNRGLRG